jgi:hypothetical protein
MAEMEQPGRPNIQVSDPVEHLTMVFNSAVLFDVRGWRGDLGMRCARVQPGRLLPLRGDPSR